MLRCKVNVVPEIQVCNNFVELQLQEYLLQSEDEQRYTVLESRSTPSITLTNITLKCRREKINMEISEGEIVSIIGSVGTGKVT